MAFDRETLLEFMKEELGVDIGSIDDDTLLFSTGLVDSFSMVSMIQFIESSSGMSLPIHEINFDNIDSVNRILAYMAGKQAG